jgi:putative endonuclease
MPNTINISKNMRFFVYIIGTKYPKVQTYVGWSNNIKKRLKAHNESKGAKFTRGSKWKLLYQEELSSKSEAMRREAHLKKDKQFRSQLRNQLI